MATLKLKNVDLEMYEQLVHGAQRPAFTVKIVVRRPQFWSHPLKWLRWRKNPGRKVKSITLDMPLVEVTPADI